MSLYSLTNWNDYAFLVVPTIDYSVRGLCARPYPGHKRGCPKLNSGHIACPPLAPLFEQHFDTTFPVFAVINEFDLRSHMEKLAVKNDQWSERQLSCCLYWQRTARKQLAEKIDYLLMLEQFEGYTSTTCPEAMGVNVSETLRSVGIVLEWPPRNIARQVALVGKLRIADI